MSKQYYNWDKNSWEDTKEISKRKAKNNKDIKKFFICILVVLSLISIMFFFNYVPQGKTIVDKVFKKNIDIVVDNWDYEDTSDIEDAVSNFNMNDAQEELLSQEDFVAPTVSPNGNGKVSVPNVESSSNIIIIEQSDIEKK